MKMVCRGLAVWGLVHCCFLIPSTLSAASGCSTSQLSGVYNAQITNIGFQSAVALPPNTTGTPVVVVGFGGNPNSLSGSLAGLGRYYFDGTGNIIGVTAASSSSPAMSTSLGTYTVNVDCSGSAKLTSGAAYDLFVGSSGTSVVDVRTDAAGGGEQGVLQRAGSCVTLSYPGSYAFAISGGAKQTVSGTSGTYPYSAAGTLNLSGSGTFTMAESLFNASGVTRSTASGTYTVGGDCSVSLTFSKDTGSNSSNFVAPSSFKFLMTDASNGLLAIQPDSATTITGTLSSQ